ncbi:hypothetical protein E6P09_18810 (plasmid) [Haloferax mediterranei ATCC 33500]|uniref:Uncharacterized protein n=1 Tax=Haloferax mediterranei (strain ATCC 33500 / DSM 1411 / JCM 8866 / NBRC 14739 / NCIMB 2177 / R-4) TaxID=523841 RepID=I3R9B9_HALMT|nr:hypothetical protein [Haloferax mediterranei]AFK20829.1 hypothetical protein HFX_4138 [Haloferax mediterranei ATCC 33500]AHZ24052.1 hypothetical protein BM92_19830 [Haloferax mediterranei ATCC 33500]ELZ97640.1 hypothetical protein C439_17028 [Haloferax mediterranei ATCC 33500]MDX5989724.1 hypothetical protein [Haloferax mediterranei ATCC 33500]QCQ77376.1 hypothetical protein E6P09_18810 [Haloferax mediterranei ATCC 33500]
MSNSESPDGPPSLEDAFRGNDAEQPSTGRSPDSRASDTIDAAETSDERTIDDVYSDLGA